MNLSPLGLLTLFTGILPLTFAQNYSTTFTNPVLNSVGADPFVVKDGGFYYLTYTTATNITILKSTSLTDWDNAEVKLAFDPPVCLESKMDRIDRRLIKATAQPAILYGLVVCPCIDVMEWDFSELMIMKQGSRTPQDR